LSVIVVDASVGVKWFVPEVHAAEARQRRNGPDELHAPAFFFDLEIANILWKKMRRAEITRADADLILGQLPALPLTRHPEPPLLASAFDLADRTQRTVYDCLYLTSRRALPWNRLSSVPSHQSKPVPLRDLSMTV
jgi:predicted nucleic acid-binding protein